MKHILLLGAGFSRNWGGWLASEVFEYLLGCPEVRGNQHLQRALWKSKDEGGFEQTAAIVLADPSLPQPERDRATQAFERALVRMFDDMNSALLKVQGLEFPSAQPHTVHWLLARFDAIFTLNQDLLLEHRYMEYGRGTPHSHGRRWKGVHLPGLKALPGADGGSADSWSKGLWTDAGQTVPDPSSQPIYKLHGSTNWRTADGASVLILGAAKAQAIHHNRLLRSYAETFESFLAGSDVRLMVIGYGFGDAHINSILERAAAAGMRMFLIDPLGSDLARLQNRTRQRANIIFPTTVEQLFEKCVIGASRRTLREIFGAEVVEHQKLERFFSEQ
jgi:hypothetical protein